MKKYFILMTIVLSTSTMAQTGLKIHNIGEALPNDSYLFNTYYKDIDNNLDKYEGVWSGSINNINLTFYINKVTIASSEFMGKNANTYHDQLVFDTKFTVAGIERINTLNTTLNNSVGHLVEANEYSFLYSEPSEFNACYKDLVGRLEMHYSNLNGVEQLVLNLGKIDNSFGTNCDDGNPRDRTPFLMPDSIILTKQ